MEAQIDRDGRADAVTWYARVSPARPPAPGLAGIRLSAGDGAAGLTVACFDYENPARAAIAAGTRRAGQAAVPGRLLAEITRSLPRHPVQISAASAAS